MSFFEALCFSSFTGHCEMGGKSCPLKTELEMIGLWRKRISNVGIKRIIEFVQLQAYSGRDFKSHSE